VPSESGSNAWDYWAKKPASLTEMFGGLHLLDMLSRTEINTQDSRLCRRAYRVGMPNWQTGRYREHPQIVQV
jgi:hypothetical protein